MSVLSIVMLVASIFFLYLVIRNINKNNILFEQAFMWIVISLVMIVISIFDVIPVYFAGLLGFELNFEFLLSACYLFLVGHRFPTNHDFIETKRADKAFSSGIIYSKKSCRRGRGKE